MKFKFLICFITLILLSFAFAGCAQGGKENETDVPQSEEESGANREEVMYITANGNKMKVLLENNASAQALTERLSSGSITINMTDYGDMEKVGELDFDLVRSDERIQARPGDVILYLGNSLTIYYDENNWNFTRLGHIEGVSSREEMLAMLGGKGEITATLSLD